MKTATQQEIVLLDERDTTPIGSPTEPPYFFGVFRGFQPTVNDPFATEGWIDHCQEMIDQWSRSPGGAKALVRRFLGRRAPAPKHLAPVVDRIQELANERKIVRVIDVGGGFGDNYHHIKKALGPLFSRVQYTVVDNERQCAFGRKYYKDKGIQFTSRMPDSAFDVAVVVGVLQYIPDWQRFVSEVCTLSSDSVFVSRSPFALRSPTFVTLQSVCPMYGSHALRKLGESNVWVINDAELDRCFRNSGFRLERSTYARDYSRQFARLPECHRDVAYFDKHYRKHTPIRRPS